MAQHRLSSLPILFSLLFIAGTAEAALAGRSGSKASIANSCRTTRFPTVCVQYLSGYANAAQSPEELVQIALAVSLYRAWHTRAYIKDVAKGLEARQDKDCQPVNDCLAQIDDSVHQLSHSLGELRGLRQKLVGDDFLWHLSNVNTWVSAALTDATSCLEGLPGPYTGKLKATLKEKVLNVAQVTSNALTLFHTYAAKYRAASAKP